MVKSSQVVVYSSFVIVLLLTGCVTITQPKEGDTTRSNSVTAEVSIGGQFCAGTFNALLDGNDVTAQFALPAGPQQERGILSNLTPGRHKLTASADTLQYWYAIPYCGGSSDTVNFCVAAQTSLSTPSKTAFAKGDNLSWRKTTDTTVGMAADANTLMTRWNLVRLGGASSSEGLIQSTENSCLCMRSIDDKQDTPIGLAMCDEHDATQQWQAIQVQPFGTGNYRFQNFGRAASAACLTESPNSVLIQRACNDTPDQLWSIRDNTNGMFGRPF